MKAHLSKFSLGVCVLAVGLLAAGGARAGAQSAAAPARAQAASTSFCGGQALCSETNDFAATITDFRISMFRGAKIIDATVHFQNKTNQPIILGYGEGSGLVLDDQGNRFGINGYAAENGVQGIGRVNGNNIDPKFVLRPGGSGDALFELAGAPGAVQGVSYEMDLTFREITPLEGHQFAPAGEFPMRFRGLANGVVGSAAGGAPVAGAAPASDLAAGSPASTACTPAGGSSLPSQVSNSSTVAGAQNALGQLRGLFGRKKAAAPAAAPAASSLPPCPPASDNGTAGVASTDAASAPGTAASAPVAATSTTTAPATARPIVTRAPAPTTTTARVISTKAPLKTQALAKAATPTKAPLKTQALAKAATPTKAPVKTQAPAKAATPVTKKTTTTTAKKPHN